MRISETGKICEDFYVIGHSAMPVYLLDGPAPVLFDAGLTALSGVYEEDIRRVLGDRSPACLFITHAHFDHIGAANSLKRTWPDMKIMGSQRAGEILARPGAVRVISSLNEESTRVMRSQGVVPLNERPFESVELDRVLSADELVEAGPEVTVKAMATPGHTWDFMSYWVPEREILVAGEAVGCDDGSGFIESEFLVDYDAYRESLELLSRFVPQVLCLGHRLVLTGEDAREHVQRSIEYAERYLTMLEEFLDAEGGDAGRVVARVKALEYDPRPSPKQLEQAYVLNTQARVRTVWERMQGGKTGAT
jgi:2-aminobenzoylacetyl-CoA thioesterase